MRAWVRLGLRNGRRRWRGHNEAEDTRIVQAGMLKHSSHVVVRSISKLVATP